ncbi:unnamed protein product, partial [marine sediment metagenome]
ADNLLIIFSCSSATFDHCGAVCSFIYCQWQE